MRSAIAVAVMLLVPVVAADWPMFHGSPLHQGSADGLIADSQVWWTWSTAGEHVEASPVVGDGIVVIVDRAGVVTALDIESGRELWKHDVGDAVYSTPALSLGRVYVASAGGNLVALDAKDGRLLAEAAIGATRAPLTVFEGKVYVGNEAGEMKALTATSLDLLWTFSVTSAHDTFTVSNKTGTDVTTCDADSKHPARPVRTAAAIHNGAVVFGSMNHYVYAVDEQGHPDGSTDLLWGFATNDIVIATPVIDATGNRVFVAGYDEHVRSVPLRPSGAGLTPCIGHTAASTWSYDVPGPVDASKVHSTPAYDGKRLYFGANNGNIYSIQASNGAAAWTHETGAPVLSSPVVSNGTVVIGGDDNLVRWLDAETGALLDQYRADAPMKSGAALHDETVIVVSVAGTVYRFGGDPPARPDLSVESLEVSGKGVIAHVANKGSASPVTPIQIWENGTLVGTYDIPALESGATTEVFHFTLATGSVIFEAVIDPDELLLEAGRENNRRSEMLIFLSNEPDVNATAAVPAEGAFMPWWSWIIIGTVLAAGGGGGTFYFLRRKKAQANAEDYYAEEIDEEEDGEEEAAEPEVEEEPQRDLGPIEDLGDDEELLLDRIDGEDANLPPEDNLLDEDL